VIHDLIVSGRGESTMRARVILAIALASAAVVGVTRNIVK